MFSIQTTNDGRDVSRNQYVSQFFLPCNLQGLNYILRDGGVVMCDFVGVFFVRRGDKGLCFVCFGLVLVFIFLKTYSQGLFNFTKFLRIHPKTSTTSMVFLDMSSTPIFSLIHPMMA